MSREEYPLAFPSGRVLQSACALIPSYSDQTSDGQVSVLKCHPWIGMLTHTILEDLLQSSITHLLHQVSQKEYLLQ